MFSTEDVREIVQSLPPLSGYQGLPPSLVLAASGHGFVTREQLRIDYDRRISQESSRVPVLQLAHDLDVAPDTIRQLVRTGYPLRLALLNIDESEVIPDQEVEVVLEKLRESLSHGVISRSEIERDYDISFRSVQSRLLDEHEGTSIIRDHLCTRVYEKSISEQALAIVDRAVTDNINIDLSAQDLSQLPGSPPKWLFLRNLEHLTIASQYTDKVLVRDVQDFIRVQSTQMKQHIFNDWSGPLLSGETAYRDIRSLDPGHVVYTNIDEALKDLKSLPGIDVVDSFAISDIWLSKLVDSRVQTLHSGEVGIIDVAQDLNEHLQSGKEGDKSLPESLYDHFERKAEQYLATALSQKTDTELHRLSTIVLTNEQYTIEQNKLLNQASEGATSQWQQVKENPDHEIKFTMSSNANHGSTIQAALAKEKRIQKACDERFSATIASLESENETAFTTFWLDRVSSRVHIYAEGLNSISDSKLQDQLSELLATYIQKELVPESISKARTQSLVMSRRSKKNVDKLESNISTSTTDIPSLVFALEKFHKKQNIPPPTPDHKDSMIQDMHRRVQKASDGPVLFLTLVVVLYARYNQGVVYATGRFAPKLMKLLKGKIGDEEYEKVEKWKEGAKKGTLTKEDKEGMRVTVTGSQEE